MDTDALETAYKQLLEVARGGAFAAPADRAAWPAEQLLAHVVVEDRLLAHATGELLAGNQPRHSNRPAFSPALLDEVARACEDLPGLVAEVRRGGLVLVRLARQLDDAAATAVPTCLVDGDEVRIDTPMPWSGVLNTHAEVDLPQRTAELEALRAA